MSVQCVKLWGPPGQTGHRVTQYGVLGPPDMCCPSPYLSGIGMMSLTSHHSWPWRQNRQSYRKSRPSSTLGKPPLIHLGPAASVVLEAKRPLWPRLRFLLGVTRPAFPKPSSEQCQYAMECRSVLPQICKTSNVFF